MTITMVLNPLDFNWGGVIQLIQQHVLRRALYVAKKTIKINAILVW